MACLEEVAGVEGDHHQSLHHHHLHADTGILEIKIKTKTDYWIFVHTHNSLLILYKEDIFQKSQSYPRSATPWCCVSSSLLTVCFGGGGFNHPKSFFRTNQMNVGTAHRRGNMTFPWPILNRSQTLHTPQDGGRGRLTKPCNRIKPVVASFQLQRNGHNNALQNPSTTHAPLGRASRPFIT